MLSLRGKVMIVTRLLAIAVVVATGLAFLGHGNLEARGDLATCAPMADYGCIINRDPKPTALLQDRWCSKPGDPAECHTCCHKPEYYCGKFGGWFMDYQDEDCEDPDPPQLRRVRWTIGGRTT